MAAPVACAFAARVCVVASEDDLLAVAGVVAFGVSMLARPDCGLYAVILLLV